MDETANLGLPLVQAAQAQKHVTVNESLARLDGLVQLVLASRSVTLPPAAVTEGVCYAVPQGAVNDWAGQAGRVAIGVNGGWVFATPAAGWRAFVRDEGRSAIHDGAGWVAGALTLSPHGAGLRAGLVEVDHALTAGPSSATALIIPAHAMLLGVTARVVEPITGTLSSWSLGNPGAVGRFGSGLGLATGSWARGMLGTPMTFYAPESVELVAAGGVFASGKVRIAVHFLEIGLPAA